MTPGLVNEIRPESPQGIVVAFVFVFIASFSAVSYARRKGANLLPPSLDRGWSNRYLDDPLQSILPTTVFVLGFVVGSLLGYSGSGRYGQHVLAWHLSFFVALILGQGLAYILFRSRTPKV
jgi:hypothetical protein